MDNGIVEGREGEEDGAAVPEGLVRVGDVIVDVNDMGTGEDSIRKEK